MTIKEEFKSELESLHESLIEVKDWMYENPELAFEEFEIDSQDFETGEQTGLESGETHCA